MAFVPGYIHDVFISYACADDLQTRGLISAFATVLTQEIAALGLRPRTVDRPDGVDIFLDLHSLQAGADLTQQVLTSARSSAVFIAFHSLAYMDSKWCQAEAQEFTFNYDPVRRNLEHRLYVVALGQRGSPSESAVSGLRSRRPRRFYYHHPPNGPHDFRFDPNCDGQVNPDGFTFRQEVSQLAVEVADTLRGMRADAPPARVFLADCSADWHDQAENIKTGLLQSNVLVLRASLSAGDWQAESRALIASADLFVDFHESAPTPVAAEQACLAAKLGRPRLRWLPGGELPAGADETLLREPNLVAEELETFKATLLARLPRPSGRYKPASMLPAAPPTTTDRAEQAPPAGAASAPAAMVLLVGAHKDDACVAQVEQVLDGLGCGGRDAFLAEDVLESPDTWCKAFQDMLELHRPGAVIFVDSMSKGSWADKRLRDFVLLVRNNVPPDRRALCLFPPRQRADRHYWPREDQVTLLNDHQLDQLARWFQRP